MTNVLGEIVQILVGGITQMASGIGSGLNTMVTSLFIDNTGTSPVLSTFGGVVAIFGGIALAVGSNKKREIRSTIKMDKIGKGLKKDNTELTYYIA